MKRYIVIWIGSGAGQPYTTWQAVHAENWTAAQKVIDQEWPWTDPDYISIFPLRTEKTGEDLDELIRAHYDRIRGIFTNEYVSQTKEDL